jgi:hypothetical protein
LGCDRNQKRYPETAYYTSTRVNLEEELARQLSPKFKLGVTYRESIGDYPYDTSLTRNFWKEEWAVWGKFKQAKNKHWDWKYRTLVWERGFDLYQDNTYLSADYQCWTKRLRFDAAISWSELNYPSEMISDDPDEEVDEGDDYKSRDEQKLSLELTRYFDTVQWGFEIFAVRKDYTYGAAVSRSGLIGKIIWEVGKFKIRLNLAPWGNASSESDYYQIKLEYNPKDVIE